MASVSSVLGHVAYLDESLEVGGCDEHVRQDGQLTVTLPVLEVKAHALLGRVERVERLLVDQIPGQTTQTVRRSAARPVRKHTQMHARG